MMFEEENDTHKFSLSDVGDVILWFLAGFVFFGTWFEVAIYTGLIGVVLGWFPGATLAWVWLEVTGRL